MTEGPTHLKTTPASLRTPVISLADVSVQFATRKGRITALENITLDFARDQFVSIVGRSGCGKSTLLRLICGLVTPSSGSLSVDGKSPAAYRTERSFGFVFQDAALLPWRSALDNIMLPMKLQERMPEPERHARALELLQLVRLHGFERHFPSQLSGGMRQRVSIARALSYDPEILLMDEPFGALDELTRQELTDQVLRLWQGRRRTIVFVTHSLQEALYMSDSVVVMASTPGRVKAVIEVDLPRPRVPTLRRTPEFISRLAQLEEAIAND